jgi:hypothetical protein
MRNNIWMKGCVLGIIILFGGSGIVQSTVSIEKNLISSNLSSLCIQQDDWIYHKIIYLDNANNDYQMHINVSLLSGGDVNCSGHCKNDFSDVRFCDIDSNVFLDYWIERQVNGEYAWFWVKLPSDVATNQEIYMYYGNPSAVSMSNGTATFLWFDDFQTNTTGDWIKVEFYDQKGWCYYNTKYHGQLDSVRLKSNMDCTDIEPGSWPYTGNINLGFKDKNDSMVWDNTIRFDNNYDLGSGATNNQPMTYVTSNNGSGGAYSDGENILQEGINDYIIELLYSYPNQYVRGKIWNSSGNLLWDKTLTSYLPNNLTYLCFLMKDLHNENGGTGTGLFYDAVHKKLIVSSDASYAWLKLNFSWMFLGTYIDPEPSVAVTGPEITNSSPETPTVDGPSSGKAGVSYNYNFIAIDPDGDEVSYYIDWGDNNTLGWFGPYPSGQIVTVSHTFLEKGTFTIRCQAKDSYGSLSDWGQLSVTMPCSYNIPMQWFGERLFERFPNAFPILRHLWGY